MRTARMTGQCVATGDGDASLPALTAPLWRLNHRRVLYPDVVIDQAGQLISHR